MLPVLVLFWKQNGMDMFDIYLLKSIFAVAVVVLEVPTGMIADHLGKRTSLLYGTALFALGHIVYAMGASFALFNLTAAVASRWAYGLERGAGKVGSFAAIISLQIGPLLLMGWFLHPLSFLLILGHQVVRGFLRPILSERILRYTYEDKRATVLSFNSMGMRFFFALTAPAVGWVARHFSIPHTLWIQAAGLGVIFVLLIVWYVRIPSKYFTVKRVQG